QAGPEAGCSSGTAFSLGARREMAADAVPPLLPPPLCGEAAAGPSLSPAVSRRDPRVRCCSRRDLGKVLGLCAPFVRALAEGQPDAAAAEGDALGNFEAALRENVTVNGQPWNEIASDSDQQSSSIKILEDEVDELVVQTAAKRKRWPKKILEHAIKTIKAEQEMLKLYQPLVTPEEIRSQPSQDAYLADMKQVTEMLSKQISGTMKSLPALIERAEGFSQALTWQPTLELCRLRQEVFASCKVKEEKNDPKLLSLGEVTPTDAGTCKTPHVLLKRRKKVESAERRRYPLRRRKIALST
ncbi:NSL1 protein, partial [Alcedo cyanopectus]|nr:NSL1 protein [Ceyx cyanopectus]